MMALVPRARDLARQLLDVPGLERRWRHVQGVGRRAGELVSTVELHQQETLVAAAWLHDIGYSPAVAATGLHSLDGARYLANAEWPPELVRLVAHHTCARIEAAQRHLEDQLSDFPFDDGPVMDALVTADLTTSPDGQDMNAVDRIAEILERYEPGHPVHTAIALARPLLLDHVTRTLGRLPEGHRSLFGRWPTAS